MGAAPERAPARRRKQRHRKQGPGDEAGDMGDIGHAGPRPRRWTRSDAEHTASSTHAGMVNRLMMIMMIAITSTRARGNSSRWPPITPAIAPEAPTIGTVVGRDDLPCRRRQPAGQIKDQKARMAHPVLEIVAEHPQEQHVAGDMHDARMQEHMRDQPHSHSPCVMATGYSASRSHNPPRRQPMAR